MYIQAFDFLREQRLVRNREIPEYLLPILFDYENKKVLVDRVGNMTFKVKNNPSIEKEKFNEMLLDLLDFFRKTAIVDNVMFYEDSAVFFVSDPVAAGLERLTTLMFLD